MKKEGKSTQEEAMTWMKVWTFLKKDPERGNQGPGHEGPVIPRETWAYSENSCLCRLVSGLRRWYKANSSQTDLSSNAGFSA